MRTYNILSLGAGIQSTAMALMGLNGHNNIPEFDFGVFSDTGAEPKEVYIHLARLQKTLNYPIDLCMKDEGLLEDLKHTIYQGKFSAVPFFTESNKGKRGQLRRQCTNQFKLKPIRQAIRRRIGMKKGQKVPVKEIHVVQWIGISYDELDRQTKPDAKWISNRYPLVEQKITRQDCIDYLEKHWDYPIAKSACTFCPYHSNDMWLDMKLNDKDSWGQAVEVDRLIRAGVRNDPKKCYLHPSLQPLDEVDFKAVKQDGSPQYSMRDECEGMCGL